MVANIIIVLVLLSAFYAYTNHNREFTATASAIQEIWSGTCRLYCRQSESSAYSGLSELVPGQAQNAGPNFVCVCESCPCGLVENVLRTCSPATNMYSRAIEFLSDCYYDLVKTLIDLYNYLERVMRSGVASHRQAQLLTVNQLNTGANINFVAKKDEIVKDKIVKSLKASRSITFKRKSETEYEPTSSRADSLAMNLEASEQIIPARGSAESLQILSDCSKCIEKGKICMVKCPREKKDEK